MAYTLLDDSPSSGGGYTLLDDAKPTPAKLGREGFKDILKKELESAGGLTRNLAGAGTALSNLYEGAKQFVGAGDQNRIEENKIIEQAAPVGAFVGNAALTAVPFGLAGNSLKAAAAVGASVGALNPVEGEQTFENIAKGKLANTALSAGLSVGGQALANKAGNYFAGKIANRADEAGANATKDAAIQAGIDMGLKTSPSSLKPTLANTIIESFGGKAATKQQLSMDNQQALQTAVRRRFGLADDVPLDRETMDAVIQQAYKTGYAPIEGLGKLQASPAYDDALRAITRTSDDASQSFPGMKSPQLERIVEGYRIAQPNSPAAEAKAASSSLAEMLAQREASRINALQQSGQMQTEAAKQAALAANFTPVRGMPRVPASLSNNAELVPKYQAAASDFAAVAGKRQSEKEVIVAAKEYVDGLKDLSTGTFDAKHAIDTIRSLRKDVDTFYSSATKTTADKVEAEAKKRISGAIERELESNLSRMGKDGEAMLSAYRQARKTIAEANTTKGAIVGDSLDAKVWANRAKKGKYLEGDFKTIGDFAERAPGAFQIPEKVGGAGISALNATAGTILGGGTLIGGGDPTTAALLAAGPAGLRYLARQYTTSRPAQNALARRLQGLSASETGVNALSRYLPVGGAVLGLEAFGQ